MWAEDPREVKRKLDVMLVSSLTKISSKIVRNSISVLLQFEPFDDVWIQTTLNACSIFVVGLVPFYTHI